MTRKGELPSHCVAAFPENDGISGTNPCRIERLGVDACNRTCAARNRGRFLLRLSATRRGTLLKVIDAVLAIIGVPLQSKWVAQAM